MPKRWRGRPAFGVVLVAGASAWLILLVRGRVPDLKSASRIVAYAAAPNPAPGKYNSEHWLWLSPNELLRIDEHRASSAAFPGAMKSFAPTTGTRFSVDTHRQTPVPGVERAWHEDPRFQWLYFDSLSPNGKWLLWSSVPNHAPQKWVVSSTDGTATSEWVKKASDFSSPAVWLPDSCGWVRFRNAGPRLTDIEMHRLDKPASVEVRPMPAEPIGGFPLGWTRDGRVLFGIWGWFTANSERAYFGALDVRRQNSRPERYAVEPPGKPSTVRWVAAAPDGRRLAWMCYRAPRRGWYLKLLHKLGMGGGGNGRIELWASDMRGGHERLLAATNAAPRDELAAGDRCEWSPDGKTLLFQLHGTVRVIDLN